MPCPHCGFANADGMNFCGRCGAKLPQGCSACGFMNPSEHMFCGKCGVRLHDTLSASETIQEVPQHIQLRGAIIPTPRQQGADGHEATTGPPRWSWARLLGRVFDLDMATCPLCRRGSLRIIAAMTQESVITRILRHLKLASVLPPIAPARFYQATFDWVA